MNLTALLISSLATQEMDTLHTPAFRQRVQAAGQLVALATLEAEAQSGPTIAAHLADMARYVPGAWAAYPLLHTLEDAGFVTATSAARSPQRRYAITEAGRVAAESLRACLLPAPAATLVEAA